MVGRHGERGAISAAACTWCECHGANPAQASPVHKAANSDVSLSCRAILPRSLHGCSCCGEVHHSIASPLPDRKRAFFCSASQFCAQCISFTEERNHKPRPFDQLSKEVMFQKVLHLLLLAAPPAQQESSDMLPSSFSSHVSRMFLICFQEKAENEEADSGQRCRRPSAALRKTTQVWLYASFQLLCLVSSAYS